MSNNAEEPKVESAAKRQKVEQPAETTDNKKEDRKMPALRLGAVAPDFEAKTTQGVRSILLYE